jgi:arylsulfatase A-like enzyme
MKPLPLLCVLTAPLIAAPKPNIVLIMVDDMGFSDIRPYGGEIDTPNLDSLAKNGLRFTQFYNSARCCPTRATLMTGLHPHQAGIGHMTGEQGGGAKEVPPAYQGNLNDSCVIFLSDNGACAEVSVTGKGDPVKDRAPGTELTLPSYGKAWANASNTPYRLYKHFTHEGGTNTPFIAHWPARIKPGRDWFREPAQLIDVMATVVDVTGATYPAEHGGRKILPIDGIPLTPAFDGKPLARKGPIFIEHEDNASVRDGEWKLVGRGLAPPRGLRKQKWQLYHITRDGTELNNLAAAHPDKVAALSSKWEAWAERVGVFPKPGRGR